MEGIDQGGNTKRTRPTMEGIAQIPKGSIVVIHGLVAMPELNGRKGKVMSFIEETGRFGVQVVGRANEPPIALKKQNFTVEMLGRDDADIDTLITRKEAAEEFRKMSGANRTSQDPSPKQTLVAKKGAQPPPSSQSSFSWSNLENGCCPMCAKTFSRSDQSFCRPDYDVECKTYRWFLSNGLELRSDCFMVCYKCGGKERALPAPWGRGPPLPPRGQGEEGMEDDEGEEEEDEDEWADEEDEEEDEAGEDIVVRGNTFFCTICEADVCPVNAAANRVAKHIKSEVHCTMKIAKNIMGSRWGKDDQDDDDDDGEYDGGDGAMARSLQFQRAIEDMQYKRSKPASASGLVVDGKWQISTAPTAALAQQMVKEWTQTRKGGPFMSRAFLAPAERAKRAVKMLAGESVGSATATGKHLFVPGRGTRSTPSCPPLIDAARGGKPDWVTALISAGADIEEPFRWLEVQNRGPYDKTYEWDGDTPLGAAVRASQAGCVQVLLAHGADPTRQSCYADDRYDDPLQRARVDGNYAILDMVETAVRTLAGVDPTLREKRPQRIPGAAGGPLKQSGWFMCTTPGSCTYLSSALREAGFWNELGGDIRTLSNTNPFSLVLLEDSSQVPRELLASHIAPFVEGGGCLVTTGNINTDNLRAVFPALSWKRDPAPSSTKGMEFSPTPAAAEFFGVLQKFRSKEECVCLLEVPDRERIFMCGAMCAVGIHSHGGGGGYIVHVGGNIKDDNAMRQVVVCVARVLAPMRPQPKSDGDGCSTQ